MNDASVWNISNENYDHVKIDVMDEQEQEQEHVQVQEQDERSMDTSSSYASPRSGEESPQSRRRDGRSEGPRRSS